MTSGNELRKLHALIEDSRVRQKSQSDAWPPAHQWVFSAIHDLSKRTLQDYYNHAGKTASHEPWKRENKNRAEWLVKQATHLSGNSANESTWRMRIENAILEPFSIEVACPKCRNRLWRSEVESSHQGTGRMWADVKQRQLSRRVCECAPEDRPHDRYERGTSKLFDDRIEEWILHEDPAGDLPRQRPDRIVGLRETGNIRMLLDQPPRAHPNSDTRRLRDLIRISPFKWQHDPLLFPFLILEAKTDSAHNNFSDIQYQTAFPIRSLLDLQTGLQLYSPSAKHIPEPLVWFLGYRGSDWKLYGCYSGLDSKSNTTYNIHHLQSGDIAIADGALQLLLIIDYLVDWARDTFRPSVIAQLCSTKEDDLENLTLGPDSDILSMRRTNDWIFTKAAETPHAQTMDLSAYDPVNHDQRTLVSSKRLPITAFGTIRPAITTRFQIVALRLTEDNVDSWLTPSTKAKVESPFNPCARKLINEITRWDEMLVVIGADLDYLERTWTSDERMTHDPFGEGPGTEYYSIFQYRCFMSHSWEIVQEMSYLAISSGALVVLRERAAFQKRHERMETFSESLRHCSGAVFKNTVDCLRSGSSWQVLQLALKSTLFFLSPEPARKRVDSAPPVEFLGFAYTRWDFVRSFIDEIMRMSRNSVYLRSPAPGHSGAKRRKTGSTRRGEISSHQTFWIFSERLTQSTPTTHVVSECKRCKRSGDDLYGPICASSESVPSQTAYGAILVVSLKSESSPERQMRYDVCLFVYDGSLQNWEDLSFVTVVEDLAQNSFVHHTIRHNPKSKDERSDTLDILWNLPLPYRNNVGKRRAAIYEWVGELGGENRVSASTTQEPSMHLWVHEQMLLHYLDQGMTYHDATDEIIEFRDHARLKYWKQLSLEEKRKTSRIPAHCVRLDDFRGQIRNSSRAQTSSVSTVAFWYPSKVRVRGG